ncbi:MAG: SPOR domain-containing protein [Betaproteobacteria bacterium]|nr:SPOR domain-containing protein [Rhodocyclales bacterium]
MNEIQNLDTDSTAEDALKRRLLNRIAVAAVVMVGLLGSLAIFDAMYAPKPLPAKVAALPPAGEAPAVETKAAEPVAEAKPEAVAKVEENVVPESSASPGAPALQPLPAEASNKPLTKPATGRPASMHPSVPVPPAASPAARPDPARELAVSPAAGRRAPASRPITQPGERHYALQMGVFGNLANAEDLRAKLELNGIPSSIEARVHVGPFTTREEVEVARAKLKELGLEGGLLLTLKK